MNKNKLQKIIEFRSIIDTVMVNIHNINNLNDINKQYYKNIINFYYNLIFQCIKEIQKNNFNINEEIIQYVYSPKRVYKFLINNPKKHVEDM